MKALPRLLLPLFLCMNACTAEMEPLPVLSGETLSVPLRLSNASKSSYGGVEDHVDNACVWVFRHSKLECYQYMEDTDELCLELVSGETYSVYAIANMYRDMEDCETEGFAITDESQMRNIQLNLQDMLVHTAECSMPMAGVLTDQLIEPGTWLHMDMVRLFARLEFSFAPDDLLGGENVSITSVRIRNSADSVTPFADSAFSPEGSGSWSAGVSDGDWAIATDIRRLNNGGRVTFYCLENCCGLSSNSDPRKKFPEGAPYGHPTYLEVKAHVDGFSLSGDVTWRFCPGENNVNDYNIRRGYLYNITLRTLFSTLDDGIYDWQITGDISHIQGTPLRLYVGQFRKFDLSPGDQVSYRDAQGHWVDFIGYYDDDIQNVSLPNGCKLTACFGDNEYGDSCNPEFYLYSDPSALDEGLSMDAVQLRVAHEDGAVDSYLLQPPLLPLSYSDELDLELSEDGYNQGYYYINFEGPLGQADGRDFKIPDWYARVALRLSDPWSIFRQLYEPHLSAELPFGFDLDCSGARPRLDFYGKTASGTCITQLSCTAFTQSMKARVQPAFPSQGYLGVRYNYLYAPNELKSASGGYLPEGVTRHAEWVLDDDADMSIRQNEIVFNSSFSGYPAFGTHELRGFVTNPHTGRQIAGSYSLDIVLYLPLIATERLYWGESSLIEATVAVATDPDFHRHIDAWETVYDALFRSETKVRMCLSLGGNARYVIPVPQFEDAAFEGAYDCAPATPSLTFMASDAAVNLSGFMDPSNGYFVYSLDIPGARLVRFEDVNTKITPAFNLYGEGNRIYECLWGRIND